MPQPGYTCSKAGGPWHGMASPWYPPMAYIAPWHCPRRPHELIPSAITLPLSSPPPGILPPWHSPSPWHGPPRMVPLAWSPLAWAPSHGPPPDIPPLEVHHFGFIWLHARGALRIWLLASQGGPQLASQGGPQVASQGGPQVASQEPNCGTLQLASLCATPRAAWRRPPCAP